MNTRRAAQPESRPRPINPRVVWERMKPQEIAALENHPGLSVGLYAHPLRYPITDAFAGAPVEEFLGAPGFVDLLGTFKVLVDREFSRSAEALSIRNDKHRGIVTLELAGEGPGQLRGRVMLSGNAARVALWDTDGLSYISRKEDTFQPTRNKRPGSIELLPRAGPNDFPEGGSTHYLLGRDPRGKDNERATPIG